MTTITTLKTATPGIAQKYDHLLKVISSKRFLTMQGLGNEVPFFICAFPPEEIVAMNRVQLDGITV